MSEIGTISKRNIAYSPSENLLGLTYCRYPTTGAGDAGNNPTGVIEWETLRSAQMPETRWFSIETSAGFYDFTTLDALITFQKSSGKHFYFGFYGTPAFYAGSTPNPTYADNVTPGRWNFNGENANPTSLAVVANFVTAVVSRYNKAGGAWFDTYGATYGKGIDAWETWNEPRDATGNGNTTGSNSVGFWWGTLAEMVDVCATQYTTIKSLDSSIVVTTPGHDDDTTAMAFANAVGAVTLMQGKDTCDCYAWHMYKRNPVFYNVQGYLEDMIFSYSGVKSAKRISENYYDGKPIWCTESGFGNSGDTAMNYFYAQPASYRYNFMLRRLCILACFDVKYDAMWSWGITGGATGYSGDMQTDTNGVIKARTDFKNNVIGKTITGYDISDAQIVLYFSDATTYTV